MQILPEHVWLIAAQSWQAAPLFPHAVWDVPAMHRSFEQQPFAHDMTSQRAGLPPPLPAPVLALLEGEPPPPVLALPPAPVLAPLLPDVALPPAPVLAPLLPDVTPLPELAAPLPLALALALSPVPLLAMESISLPSAHAASPTTTTPRMVMNRYIFFILAPRVFLPC